MLKDLMKWRFACKKFDATRDIDEVTLNDMLDSARLSPSSYGLQGWKFIVVKRNEGLRQKLLPVCFNQPQITEASALVFLCARTDGDAVLHQYMDKYAADMGKTREDTKPFEEMVQGTMNSLPADQQIGWLQRQVYLPCMTLMLAAAEKEIDSCPMEGFDPDGVHQVLELPENLKPTVLVSLGYRNMEQPPKSRFDLEDVVEIIG